LCGNRETNLKKTQFIVWMQRENSGIKHNFSVWMQRENSGWTYLVTLRSTRVPLDGFIDVEPHKRLKFGNSYTLWVGDTSYQYHKKDGVLWGCILNSVGIWYLLRA